jgi:hypothetical protein
LFTIDAERAGIGIYHMFSDIGKSIAASGIIPEEVSTIIDQQIAKIPWCAGPHEQAAREIVEYQRNAAEQANKLKNAIHQAILLEAARDAETKSKFIGSSLALLQKEESHYD